MSSTTDVAAPTSRWLFGPARDLIFGCGLWYVGALALLCLDGPSIRMATASAVLPLLVLLFGTPHYGATLLRVYERRQDRRGYAIFSVWSTALLAVLFVMAVYQPILGSLILTVYLTWSPWHYTGQNYGLAVMFLRRRGVPVSDGEKRVLYGSFFLSFLLTFLAQHGGAATGSFVPLSYAGAGYSFLPLGIPESFTDWALPVVGVGYVACTGLVLATWMRRSRARDWLPAAALVASQSLWFTFPLAARHWRWFPTVEPFAPGGHEYYFFWIAIAHSVQYLWITSYYARAEGDWSGIGPYFLKAMLAGAAIWTIPALIFAPSALGRLPFDAGLSVLVASTVNIHHFVLDGAIWKLRDGRVARILLRARDAAASAAEPPHRRWLAPAVWALGAVSVLVMFGSTAEQRLVLERAINELRFVEAERSMERLNWMGRDSAIARAALAKQLASKGRMNEAEWQQRRAIALHESAQTWGGLGMIFTAQGESARALEAFERAIELAPDIALLHHRAGEAALALGDVGRARDEFARAAELDPGKAMHRLMLERAERELGQPGDDAAAAVDPPAES
ncbi:MAG: tetratricopeptide repeat protein [Myxococcota bacterium]